MWHKRRISPIRLALPVLALALALTLATHPRIASSEPNADYKLPWSKGVSYGVKQGNYEQDSSGKICAAGCFTHWDSKMRYAWDFGLPEGTTVRAVRAGRVAYVQSHWPKDHCGSQEPIMGSIPSYYVVSKNIANEGNYVVIDHGDGTSALYLHLSKVSDSVITKIATGEPVAQGDELGSSGKTGWTLCNPHLHFQVQETGNIWYEQSRSIHFSDSDVVSKTNDGIPREGQSYVSGNTGGAAPTREKVDWKNSKYRITCDNILESGFNVTLTNGVATVSGKPAAAAGYDHFEVKLAATASGEITRDAGLETLVLIRCSPQPSNFFVEEALALTSGQKLIGELPSPTSLKGQTILPPQYVPSKLKITGGTISADMMFYGPEDTHASGPSVRRNINWRWDEASRSFIRAK
jgi:hypothetical protein